MNLIIYGFHLFPFILANLETDIIIATALTTIAVFMLSKEVGMMWSKFKVKR